MIYRLLLLSLVFAANTRAEPQGTIFLETYEVPRELWDKTPLSLKNDGSGLRAKLVELTKSGAVKRVDVSGTTITDAKKSKTDATRFLVYPTEFYSPYESLIPNALEAAQPGSSNEMEAHKGGDLRVDYATGPLNLELVPTLAKGSSQNRERSSLPAFNQFRISTGFIIPEDGVELIGYGASTPFERASKAIWVTFVVTAPDSTYTNKIPKHAINQFCEFVVTRGPLSPPETDAATLLEKHLSAGKSDVSLAVVMRLGQKSRVESTTEIVQATEAFANGSGDAVPTALQMWNVGDSLELECHPGAAEKISLSVHLKHDYKEPVLPRVPGRGRELIDNDTTFYKLEVHATWQVNPNEWTLLTTTPLDPILPNEGEGQAAYVFARVTRQ